MTNPGDWLPGVHVAPNIQGAPELYELENRCADPEQRVEAAMERVDGWAERLVLDLGCGTGFHLPRFADKARHVFGVEPHGPSRLRAMARLAEAGIANASVLAGSAELVPLRDHFVDVAQARFAYFWGPGCEAGLVELERVVKPGGHSFIIDNDWRRGTFADWLGRSAYCANINPQAVEQFWQAQGFERISVLSEWRFDKRSDLERVVANEFPPELVSEVLAEHEGLSISYGFAIYHRAY